MLQLREKEIFETLRKIKQFKFVVIGGYAVNSYTLPRFSVDCDIVVEDAKDISKELIKLGYSKKNGDDIPYAGNFYRYEKEIMKNFRVSVDILLNDIIDRQTNSKFSVDWVFKNSSNSMLRGKTITESIGLRVLDIDALLVMKIISCRATDVRDVFMLILKAKDLNWVKEEINKRCNFDDRIDKVKDKVRSKSFKDDLQGVYGFIDEGLFEKHKKKILGL